MEDMNRIGDTVFVKVTDKYMSDRVRGYRLSDWHVEWMVDNDVEFICFINESGGRYTISLEDWIDYRVYDGKSQHQHVAQAFFTYG